MDTAWNIEDNIRITQLAYEKSEYLARTICKMTLEPLEIGFYYTGNNELSDVYFPIEQDVFPKFCDISCNANEIFSRDNENISGWGHSHANFNPYYSDDDKETIAAQVLKWGIKRKRIRRIKTEEVNGGLTARINGDEYFIGGNVPFGKISEYYVFYGLTFNSLSDRPYARIAQYDGKSSQRESDFTIIEGPCSFSRSKLDECVRKGVKNIQIKNPRPNYDKCSKREKAYGNRRKQKLAGLGQ